MSTLFIKNKVYYHHSAVSMAAKATSTTVIENKDESTVSIDKSTVRTLAADATEILVQGNLPFYALGPPHTYGRGVEHDKTRAFTSPLKNEKVEDEIVRLYKEHKDEIHQLDIKYYEIMKERFEDDEIIDIWTKLNKDDRDVAKGIITCDVTYSAAVPQTK